MRENDIDNLLLHFWFLYLTDITKHWIEKDKSPNRIELTSPLEKKSNDDNNNNDGNGDDE